jgi:flagellar hook-length control protein FliK
LIPPPDVTIALFPSAKPPGAVSVPALSMGDVAASPVRGSAEAPHGADRAKLAAAVSTAPAARAQPATPPDAKGGAPSDDDPDDGPSGKIELPLPQLRQSAAPPAPAAAESSGPAQAPALESITRLIIERARIDQPVLHIRLQLDQLGAIDVDLRRGPDGVRVEISAELPDTRRLLAHAAPALAQEIRAAGVGLDSVNVAGGNTASFSGAFQGEGGERPNGRGPSWYEGSSAVLDAPAPRPSAAATPGQPRLNLLA